MGQSLRILGAGGRTSGGGSVGLGAREDLSDCLPRGRGGAMAGPVRSGGCTARLGQHDQALEYYKEALWPGVR